MIRNNEDLYAFVRTLADQYRRNGMPREAEDLLSTLSISTVPGEVLGEIRAVLQRLPLDGPGDPGRLQDALASLSSALGYRRGR